MPFYPLNIRLVVEKTLHLVAEDGDAEDAKDDGGEDEQSDVNAAVKKRSLLKMW